MKCEDCEKRLATETHHMIFKSQGGFLVCWNEIRLCNECHHGDVGPHKNHQKDVEYKIRVQEYLEAVIVQDRYTYEELVELICSPQIGLKKQVHRVVKTIPYGYSREDIIRRLTGGKLYQELGEQKGVA